MCRNKTRLNTRPLKKSALIKRFKTLLAKSTLRSPKPCHLGSSLVRLGISREYPTKCCGTIAVVTLCETSRRRHALGNRVSTRTAEGISACLPSWCKHTPTYWQGEHFLWAPLSINVTIFSWVRVYIDTAAVGYSLCSFVPFNHGGNITPLPHTTRKCGTAESTEIILLHANRKCGTAESTEVIDLDD